MLPLAQDPRFASAITHFNDGDWLEASDLFEELFFDAVGDEVPLVRVLLQVSTGLHHVSRGQRRAAIERLEEGIRAVDEVTNARGIDVTRLVANARRSIEEIRAGRTPATWTLESGEAL